MSKEQPAEKSLFAFQEDMIRLLGIPEDVADTIVSIDIHLDWRSQPIATITHEILHNGDLDQVQKKYTICEIVEGT